MDRELDGMVLGSGDYPQLVEDAYASNIHRSVHLEGNPLTENEVRETAALMKRPTSSPYDEPIAAALFFHEFESIHPFTDGNGRTLFQLLQMLGLRNCRLCKFEYEMLHDRERYCTLLAYADSSQNYAPFIMYTADAVLRAYTVAAASFAAKDRTGGLDESSKKPARSAKAAHRFTVAQVCF